MKAYFHILWLVLIVQACVDMSPVKRVSSIWVKNNSDSSYTFLFSYDYPDTVISEDLNKVRGLRASGDVPVDSKKKWELVFKEDLPKDTLSVFIFRKDTGEENWEQVKRNYEVIYRYDLSYKDIQLLQHRVPIPPSNIMSSMKVYKK